MKIASLCTCPLQQSSALCTRGAIVCMDSYVPQSTTKRFFINLQPPVAGRRSVAGRAVPKKLSTSFALSKERILSPSNHTHHNIHLQPLLSSTAAGSAVLKQWPRWGRKAERLHAPKIWAIQPERFLLFLNLSSIAFHTVWSWQMKRNYPLSIIFHIIDTVWALVMVMEHLISYHYLC